MNPVITVFLTCLLLLCTQGLPHSRSNKCKCLNGYVKKTPPQLIKEEPRVFLPSVFCPRTEIIITTTANQQKCLNPQSPLGQVILKRRNMQDKRGAETTTTTTTTTTRHRNTSTNSTMTTTTTL